MIEKFVSNEIISPTLEKNKKFPALLQICLKNDPDGAKLI